MNEALVEIVAKAMCIADSADPESGSALWDNRGILWAHYNKQARAALSAIESSGTHVVVPVDADWDMISAAYDESGTNEWPLSPGVTYVTMLAARPKVTE